MPLCHHYWTIVGGKGRRWFKSHALAKCVHCGAWTVVEYGLSPGPCGHVVGTIPPPGAEGVAETPAVTKVEVLEDEDEEDDESL